MLRCAGAVVREVQRLLGGTARWSVDDDLLGLVHEIVGAAL